MYCKRCGKGQVETPTGRLCPECKHVGYANRLWPLGDPEKRTLIKERRSRIEALLADPNLTHADISREVGISRERVRQIALKSGESGCERRKKNPALAAQKVVNRIMLVAKRRKPNGKWMSVCVNRWLCGIGHFYCWYCRGAVPMKENSKSRGGNICKACVRQKRGKWCSKPENKAKQKAWVEANREKCRGYMRKYYAAKKQAQKKAVQDG